MYSYDPNQINQTTYMPFQNVTPSIQPQLVQAPFGLMIPGQLAVTSFEQANNFVTYTLLNPGTIHSIGFFLFQAIGNDSAASLYYSVPPYKEIQFLGAIANTRPSDIFPTNFSLNPEINCLPELKLAITIQPMDQQLKELVELTSDSQNQIKYAKAIAQNLYNFMSNYNQQIMVSGQMQEMLVTPINVLDKWITRFQEKYKIDPNFIFKTTQ